jgi:hypothetical protein
MESTIDENTVEAPSSIRFRQALLHSCWLRFSQSTAASSINITVGRCLNSLDGDCLALHPCPRGRTDHLGCTCPLMKSTTPPENSNGLGKRASRQALPRREGADRPDCVAELGHEPSYMPEMSER